MSELFWLDTIVFASVLFPTTSAAVNSKFSSQVKWLLLVKNIVFFITSKHFFHSFRFLCYSDVLAFSSPLPKPNLWTQKCMRFNPDATVWVAKQRILCTLNQSLKDVLNYGLFQPASNGRDGKFLDEERIFREYPQPISKGVPSLEVHQFTTSNHMI